jgi:hypothetical protein
MTFLATALLTATFLCSLVAGFLLAFAIVVMPALPVTNSKPAIALVQPRMYVSQSGQVVSGVIAWPGGGSTFSFNKSNAERIEFSIDSPEADRLNPRR